MVKKIVRIIAIVIVSIILVNIILFITLSIPALQKKAAGIAMDKLRPLIGTDASLDGIRIRLFNTVELNGLYVEDRQQDTLLYVERLTARILPLDLLRNSVTLRKAGMENFVAHVHRASPEEPFNFQFIIDAFAKEKDTTVVKVKKPWRITADDVVLKNGTLRYDVRSVAPTPGQFNAAHLDLHQFNFRGKADFLSIADMKARVELLTFHEHNAGITLHNLKTEMLGKGPLISSDRLEILLNHTDIIVTDARYDRKTKAFAVRAASEHTDPGDVALFTDRFAQLNKPLSFEVDAEGELPQAILRNLRLQYGSDTRIDASGTISDYSRYDNSELTVDVQHLSVSQEDLEAFIRVGAPDYASPEQLLALGHLELQLHARGRLDNFRYDGMVQTEQGDVAMDGTGRITNQFKHMVFEGPVIYNWPISSVRRPAWAMPPCVP